MAREAISPAQKLVNRYFFNGAVFTGIAALALGRYAWVGPSQIKSVLLEPALVCRHGSRTQYCSCFYGFEASWSLKGVLN